MVIKFDSLYNYETPKLILCNPGCVKLSNGALSNVVGVINDATAEELVLNFNEVSEVNFRINKIQRDSDCDEYVSKTYYDIQNRRLIYVEDIGFFVITNVNESTEFEMSYKDVTAQSCEFEIQQKNIPYIENGTYLLYTNEGDGVLNKILPAIPSWKINHIDESLLSKYRTFEDVDVNMNCLGFLMENIQDAYECIILYDNIYRNINIYDRNTFMSDKQTDILISNNDIAKSINITENADDLYTALSVLGADEVSINTVNPIGSNVIYNFTNYLSWMSEGLKERVMQWQALLKLLMNSNYVGNESSLPEMPILSYEVGDKYSNTWLSLEKDGSPIVPDESHVYFIMNINSNDFGNIYKFSKEHGTYSECQYSDFMSYNTAIKYRSKYINKTNEITLEIEMLQTQLSILRKCYTNIVAETTCIKKTMRYSGEISLSDIGYIVKPEYRPTGINGSEIGAIEIYDDIPESGNVKVVTQTLSPDPLPGQFYYNYGELADDYYILFNSEDCGTGYYAKFSYEKSEYSGTIDTYNLEECNQAIVESGGEPIENFEDISITLKELQDRISKTEASRSDKILTRNSLEEIRDVYSSRVSEINNSVSLLNFFATTIVYGKPYLRNITPVTINHEAQWLSEDCMMDDLGQKVLSPRTDSMYVVIEDGEKKNTIWVWNGTEYDDSWKSMTHPSITPSYTNIDSTPLSSSWLSLTDGLYTTIDHATGVDMLSVDDSTFATAVHNEPHTYRFIFNNEKWYKEYNGKQEEINLSEYGISVDILNPDIALFDITLSPKGQPLTPEYVGDIFVVLPHKNGYYASEYDLKAYYWSGSQYVYIVRNNIDMYNELMNYIYQGSYTDEYVSITESMDYEKRIDQYQLLLNRGLDRLSIISKPKRELKVDVESIIFNQEFYDISSKLETGSIINIELNDGSVSGLFLSNMTVNYEDNSFTMTFGDECTKYDTKTLFDSVLGSVTKTANTVSEIENVLQPLQSNYNSMKDKLENVRSVTMKDAITSQNQDVVIDSSGYLGRKKREEGFDPHQVKITNQNITFTNDGWQTSGLALGLFEDIDGAGSSAYGINAEAIVGDMIIGNNLVIKNNNGEDAFKVVENKITSMVGDISSINTKLSQDIDNIKVSVTSIENTISGEGQNKYQTTSGVFDENGLTISTDTSNIVNTVDNTGMYVKKRITGGSEAYIISGAEEYSSGWLSATDGSSTPLVPIADNVYVINSNGDFKGKAYEWSNIKNKYVLVKYTDILSANTDGVVSLNMTARQYLTIGKNSRLEDYKTTDDEHRTGCFYIYQ